MRIHMAKNGEAVMGMYYDAYVLYGVKVADPSEVDFELYENLNEVEESAEYQIGQTYGVHLVLVGHYDRDMMFLATTSTSVSLGGYKLITERNFKPEIVEESRKRVLAAAKALGLTPQTEPGWFLVPDLS